MSGESAFTAFVDGRCIARGALEAVAQGLAAAGTAQGAALVFDDADGRPVELDPRLAPAAAAAEHRARTAPQAPPPAPRGRGRPRLGVVAREVTLLPRHWDWLARQPGGASAALRRLVEAARKDGADAERTRAAREAAYRVMAALAGDAPGFEAASRALFAGDLAGVAAQAAGWPPDVAGYVLRLARAAPGPEAD